MTLDTRVYLHDVTDRYVLRDVFAKCNALLGADEGTRFRENSEGFMNEPAQGLATWLSVSRCDGHPAEVSFDTAYSYEGPDGGCGDLHARLVAELGQWLDRHGIRWSWLNEFTGEVHEGYEGLTELGDAGAEATAWYREIVMPALRIAGGI